MKNTLKKIVCSVLALALCVSAFAACGSGNNESSSSGKASTASTESKTETSGTTTNSGEKIDPTACEDTMDVTIAVMTGFTQSDSRVEKMLEEKYNVNIELVVLPGWTDGQSKINLLMAGDDTPNIMWWWGMDNDFLQWKNAGKLVDVSEYMNKYMMLKAMLKRCRRDE